MTALQDLNAFISTATTAYRKEAEVVKEEDVNGIRVITINGYPEAPSMGELVDVGFLKIGFTDAAGEKTAEQFLDMIVNAEHGDFGDMTLERLKAGPSYIEHGGWLGSQDQALRFLALGQHYGLWKVMHPYMLGVEDETMAQEMMGNGFVMNSGLKMPEPAQ
jgi:hypothetical protein